MASSSPIPAIGSVALDSRALARDTATRPVAIWLFMCCALVWAMVVVGGVTRLTHSGLSITEWQPIIGTLPPLSDSDWQEAFGRYRETPEYQQVNHGMSLSEFKGIFWWEYFHRLLGRLIGVAFLLPLMWFAAQRAIPPGYAPKLLAIFILGGLQGALGWYMVQSGLVDDPRVSQFRLTAHLGLALLIFGAMLWAGLSLWWPDRTTASSVERRPLRRYAMATASLIFVMALTGGFVAGIRAGFAYNTFPLMNGHVVPPEIFMLEPWWTNFFYNMATVQFDHRLIAWLLAFAVPLLWWKVRVTPGAAARSRLAAHLLIAVLVLQITLGISTLVLGVPLAFAAAHQAGAVTLFGSALTLAYTLR